MKTIKVSDMSCMHCVKTITTALDEAGIKNEVVLEEKIVKVDEPNVAKAIEVIKESGYEAE